MLIDMRKAMIHFCMYIDCTYKMHFSEEALKVECSLTNSYTQMMGGALGLVYFPKTLVEPGGTGN